VKRRKSLPLFRSIEPDTYLIDTSAWSNIDLRKDCDDVWNLIYGLLDEGRIVACSRVVGELRDGSSCYLSRIKPYEKTLMAGDRNSDDIEYLMLLGRTFEHPGMSRAAGLIDPADPYIVALAELEGYVVVSDETKRKRASRKIPGVCEKRGIRCISLEEFIAEASGKKVRAKR
jgi:hypothetical protein